tara:strand:+ start:1954 stop:3699 length:1746 start_codon:yes stop_codon:yes gene_type:complete
MKDYLNAIKLLEKKYFKKYIFTNLLIIIGSIFELLSLSLIIPLFYFLGDIENKIIKINNFIGYELISDDISRGNIIYILIFLFIFFYFIKSIIITFVFILTKKFVNNHEQILAEKVYSNYVFIDFIKSIKKNEAAKFRNIHEVSAHSLCLQSTFIINQEILTSIFIFLAITVIDPYIGLSLLVLSIFLIFSFNFFTKKKLTFLGEKKRELDAKNFRNIVDALNSLKEIKIFHKENFFVKEFSRIKKITLNNQFENDIFSFYPKILIELFVLSTFVIYFVITFIEIDISNINSIIPKVVFLVIAAFRVLPSINRIILNVQLLKKNSASINNIYREKFETKIIKNILSEKNVSFKKEITFNNVNFGYESDQTVLRDVNLSIKKGEIVGIYGSSGSGKTTFINLFLALLKPSKGSIKIDDKHELFENSFSWHKLISFVPQKIFTQNTNITKNIAFGVPDDLINEDKINQSIKISNLENFVANTHEANQVYIGDKAERISGGQAQRIGIARSIYKNPEILILDEATNNLDEKNEYEIISNLRKYFKEKNNTIIISSHNLDLLRNFCDEILFFNNKVIKKLNNNLQ